MNSLTSVAAMDSETDVLPQENSAWLRRTLWLISGLLVFRLAYAAVVPLDLVHDEAYYWDWSRQLDWGYYSKPPMIAWLIAASTSLLGSTTLTVRLPAVVLGTGGLILVYLFASRLYGRKAGFWAVLLSAATPGNAALSLLMTIDAPFLFCWSATLYCFWRFLQRDRQRVLWLTLATVATGVGLLCKQTMLGFVPLAGVFLLAGSEDRRELVRPAFWLWVAGSLIFLTPVLWWNWQHDWITAQHTGGHFAGSDLDLLKRLSLFGEFVACQFGVASPVTCSLVVAALALGLFGFAKLGRKERFLICFSGLPMMGVLCLALTRRVQPNWPAPFYPTGLVLVVGWALGMVPSFRPLRDGQRALRRAVVVGVLFVLVAYVACFGWGVQGSKLDPAVRLRGWRQLGVEMDARLAQMPRPESTFMLFVTSRAAASESAFYMPRQPRVFLWNDSGSIASQYDIWGGPTERKGWDAMIVSANDKPLPDGVRSAFRRVRRDRHLRVPIGNGRAHNYWLWRGERFLGASPAAHVAEGTQARRR
jgi:undecaprenyl-diphosphatase